MKVTVVKVQTNVRYLRRKRRKVKKHRTPHSEEKIGGNNHKGNNKHARESVKIEPNKQELTNRRLKKA